MDFLHRFILRDRATTLEDEVAAATPIGGSLDDYAPKGDNGSKESTDQHVKDSHA